MRIAAAISLFILAIMAASSTGTTAARSEILLPLTSTAS